MTEVTGNFKFEIPTANTRPWHEWARRTLKSLDAVQAMLFTISGYRGAWENSTAYAVDDVALDVDSGVLYKCANAHTSAGGSTTFQTDRSNNSTRWTAYASTVGFRGAWASTTIYEKGDAVVSGDILAIAAAGHTSTTTFANDNAAGLWTVLIDFGSVQAAAEAAQAAAEAAAATIPDPTQALNYIRVKSSVDGYEHRTPAEVRSDIGADDIANLTTGTLPIARGGTGAVSAGAARTALGLIIGADVQAFDADILKSNASVTLTVGYTNTPYDIGNSGTGTQTPDASNGFLQMMTMNGSFTLDEVAVGVAIDLLLIIDGTGGYTLTASGYDYADLTPLNTNASAVNLISLRNYAAGKSVLVVKDVT